MSSRNIPNLKLLGSYIFWQDGKHSWYECVLIDPLNPSIRSDYNYRRVLGAELGPVRTFISLLCPGNILAFGSM